MIKGQILSENSLNILIENLSLEEYTKVMGDISAKEDKLLEIDNYINRLLKTEYKLDLDAVLITIKSMLDI